MQLFLNKRSNWIVLLLVFVVRYSEGQSIVDVINSSLRVYNDGLNETKFKNPRRYFNIERFDCEEYLGLVNNSKGINLVEINSAIKEKYSFYTYQDSLFRYALLKRNRSNNGEGYYFNGILLYDKSRDINLYIGFSFPLLYQIKNYKGELDLILDIDRLVIDRIFLLDNSLVPTIRANISKNVILTYSGIKKVDDEFIEEISICERFYDIETIGLDSLIEHLKSGSLFEGILMFTVKPKYNEYKGLFIDFDLSQYD
ncbi:hypothetical protein DMA11_23775 [Marinilabiliaceae bacterium JC017]|nr:hypothetical protein DMA11_23775 [Marinilabiliaceae bacterium JC017]